MKDSGSTDHRYESGRMEHARLEESVTAAVQEPVLSQEGQNKTHRLTRQISRDGSNTV